MSGQVTGWVYRHGPRDRAERTVLLAIAEAANADGRHAHPGMANLVEFTLYTRSTVFAVIRRLIDGGWLEVEQRGRGRGHATVFRVVMDREKVQRPDPLPVEKGPISEPKRSDSEPEKVRFGESSLYSSTDIPTSYQRPHTPIASGAGVPPVEHVFNVWRMSTGKAGCKLDEKRRRRILAALRDYPEQDVIDAVKGWRSSPFHRGENPEGKVWNEITLLLRDAHHIEMFRDAHRGLLPQGRGKLSDRERMYVELLTPSDPDSSEQMYAELLAPSKAIEATATERRNHG